MLAALAASSACLLAEVLRPLPVEEEEELLWEDDWAPPTAAALVELCRERRPPPAVVEDPEGAPLAEEVPWEGDLPSSVALEGLWREVSSLVLEASGFGRRDAAVLPLVRGPTPAPAPEARRPPPAGGAEGLGTVGLTPEKNRTVPVFCRIFVNTVLPLFS